MMERLRGLLVRLWRGIIGEGDGEDDRFAVVALRRGYKAKNVQEHSILTHPLSPWLASLAASLAAAASSATVKPAPAKPTQ